MSAPELSVQLARRALLVGATDASAATTNAVPARDLSMRAQAVLAAGLVRISQHASAVEPGFAALGIAESIGENQVAAAVRLDLAACAQEVGEPLLGGALLRPVLDDVRTAPVVRATALGRLVSCVAHVARRDDIEDALAEADRLIAADDTLSTDARRMERARLAMRTAAYHRWYGDTEDAVAAARDGLNQLNRSRRELRSESDRLHAKLVLELVCGLLDEGELTEAQNAAGSTVDQPVRATSAAAVGQLMLAMATRVHLPAGEVDRGRGLLDQAAWMAERHGLDAVLADALTEVSRLDEQAGRTGDALKAMRLVRAAEQRRMRAMARAARHVLVEVGANHGMRDTSQQEVSAMVRQLAHPGSLPVSVAPPQQMTPTPTRSALPSRTAQEPQAPPAAAELAGTVDMDSGTGLLNQEGLIRRLRTVRRDERPVALTLVRFEPNKAGEEDRGPDTGIIAGLADKVRGFAPDNAELARPDGGELAVLLPDTTRDQAEEFAATVRETAIESEWLGGGSGKEMSISTGVVQSNTPPADDDKAAGMLTAARDALTPAGTPSHSAAHPGAHSAAHAANPNTQPAATAQVPTNAGARTPAQSPTAGDSLMAGQSSMVGDSLTAGQSSMAGDSLMAGQSLMAGDSLMGSQSSVAGGSRTAAQSPMWDQSLTAGESLTAGQSSASDQSSRATRPSGAAHASTSAHQATGDRTVSNAHPTGAHAASNGHAMAEHAEPAAAGHAASGHAAAGSAGTASAVTGTPPVAEAVQPSSSADSLAETAAALKSALSEETPTTPLNLAKADTLGVGRSILSSLTIQSGSGGRRRAEGESAPGSAKTRWPSESSEAPRWSRAERRAKEESSSWPTDPTPTLLSGWPSEPDISQPLRPAADQPGQGKRAATPDKPSFGETRHGESTAAIEKSAVGARHGKPAAETPENSENSEGQDPAVPAAASGQEPGQPVEVTGLARYAHQHAAEAAEARQPSAGQPATGSGVDQPSASAVASGDAVGTGGGGATAESLLRAFGFDAGGAGRRAARRAAADAAAEEQAAGEQDAGTSLQPGGLPLFGTGTPAGGSAADRSSYEETKAELARMMSALNAKSQQARSGKRNGVSPQQSIPTPPDPVEVPEPPQRPDIPEPPDPGPIPPEPERPAEPERRPAGEPARRPVTEPGPDIPAVPAPDTAAPNTTAPDATAPDATAPEAAAAEQPEKHGQPGTRSGLMAAFDALTGPVPGSAGSTFKAEFEDGTGLPSRKPAKSWAEIQSAAAIDSPADNLFGKDEIGGKTRFRSSLGAAFAEFDLADSPAGSPTDSTADSPTDSTADSPTDSTDSTGTNTERESEKKVTEPVKEPVKETSYDEPLGPERQPPGPPRRGERSSATIASLLTEALAAYQSTTADAEVHQPPDRYDSFAADPAEPQQPGFQGRHRSPE